MKETNLPEKVEAFGVKVDNSAKPAIPQPQTARRPNIRRLRPKTALKVLLAIDALFIAMSATAELVRYSFYVRQQPVPQQILRVIQLVDVNLELNIPTWYSSMMIMACAILLAIIARGTPPDADRRYWWGLSVIFALLSLDELASLHNSASSLIQQVMNTSGIFALAWVIPGIIFVAGFVAAYVPFLRRLPPRTRKGFLVAGALFVTGAVVFEMLGAWYSQQPDMRYMVYAAIWTVEEALEMVAISIFVYILLRYMARQSLPLSIPLQPPPPPTE